MLDLGPNLGALNRSILAASDYFIVPMSPDLFSIRGTMNLGKKLQVWRKGWDQCNDASSGDIELPKGSPIFLGYVMQQHNIRKNSKGMTRGWSIFGDQVEDSVRTNIIGSLAGLGQVHDWRDDNWNIGQIPNLHSLIPYSLNARKPVFDCTAGDGLNGAHITTAKDSANHFSSIVNKLMSVV